MKNKLEDISLKIKHFNKVFVSKRRFYRSTRVPVLHDNKLHNFKIIKKSCQLNLLPKYFLLWFYQALDDNPKIVKTIISGNIITFYDENGTLLGTENIPIPNHSDLVKTIKDIGKDFSSCISMWNHIAPGVLPFETTPFLKAVFFTIASKFNFSVFFRLNKGL